MIALDINNKIYKTISKLLKAADDKSKGQFIVHLGELELAISLYQHETKCIHPEQKNLVKYYSIIWEL